MHCDAVEICRRIQTGKLRPLGWTAVVQVFEWCPIATIAHEQSTQQIAAGARCRGNQVRASRALIFGQVVLLIPLVQHGLILPEPPLGA